MGTVADKLNKALSTKAAIKAALIEKGQEVSDTDTFASYADKVLAIKSGGLSNPMDPVEVYKATRPADWLPMPEPQDDEMYLLFHIPDGVSSLLAFTVTCTGDYTVALGTVTNGQFVQQSSTSVPSEATYEAELFADDYGDLTSDGFKQVMIKISGKNIAEWRPDGHSKKPDRQGGWNIKDIVCRLPSGASVLCSAAVTLTSLRYFAWYGKNQCADMNNMFGQCISLTAIPYLDTSHTVSAVMMFKYCSSLIAIPDLDTSALLEASEMFYGCSSFVSIPRLDTSSVVDMQCMFEECCDLTVIPQLDTSAAENMNHMFYMSENLSKITFNPNISNWAGADISLEGCSLGHKALVNLFNSLPTITSSKTLTITGNPGVSELTDAEKAIATGKNWTLTL